MPPNTARKSGEIEPVVDYKYFIDIVRQFRQATYNLRTQMGTPIRGLSDHSIGRFPGARKDYTHLDKHGRPKRRIGTSISNVLNVIKHGKMIENSTEAEGYVFNGWKIVISKRKNNFGKVVTIMPQKCKGKRKKRD